MTETDSILRAPPGAVTLRGDEVRRRRRVEAGAAEVFAGWGYEEILLPLFDHAYVFARGGGRWSERSSYRFTEGGDLLALRADFTALAARAASVLLPAGLDRLSYRGEVVRRPARSLGPAASREVGLEHFRAGVGADLEVLLVALEVLERLDIGGFVFTLGHAGFPLGLLDDALAGNPEGGDCERRRAETLRGLWRRDRGRIRAALGDAAPAVTAALDLTGGPEALEAAAALELPARARQAVERLQELAALLDGLGLADRFRFDLAELRGFDYYTGLIFEIHAPGAGSEIGGGGRYDDLLARFGDARPAVGFSLSVDRIAPLLPAAPHPPASASLSAGDGPRDRRRRRGRRGAPTGRTGRRSMGLLAERFRAMRLD